MADNPETHSKRVARLRKILPALAGVAFLILLLGAAPDMRSLFGSKGREEIRNALAGLAISDPVFEGNLSTDGRSYRMTAKSGAQGLDGRIQLEAISLTVSAAKAGSGFRLRADSGLMDGAKQIAQFQGSIDLQDSHGAKLTTQTLNADLAQGTLLAPQAVSMQAPSGTLHAEALRADTKTQTYVFDKARLRLAPRRGQAK